MEEPETLPAQPLRRRNSIAEAVPIPSRLHLHTSSLPPSHTCFPSPSQLDFELYSFQQSSSYTSLKDLLHSPALNSPTAAAAASLSYGSAYEICIRNHLVKQAAWAYLQPMSSSPGSSSPPFLRRLWLRLSALHNPIAPCFRFLHIHLIPGIARALRRIFRSIWVVAA